MAPAGPLLTSLSTIRKNPKWTMSGRDNADDKMTMKRMMSAPGPGQYGNPKQFKFHRQPAAMFGTCERDAGLISSQQRPGPGQYAPQPSKCSTQRVPPQYRFPQAERIDEGLARAQRSRTPGPGAYDLKPMLDKMSPLITSRFHDKKRSATPGPGHYQTPRNLGGAKYGFGKANRPELGSNPSMKAYPGPGTYPIPSTLSGKNPLSTSLPSFTMTPRRADPYVGKNKNPGPGAHGGCYTTFGY